MLKTIKNRISLFALALLSCGAFFACNSSGTAGGETKELPSTITDIDGNVYKTVVIGGKVWMAENLKVSRYRNGDPVVHTTGEGEWSNLSSGAFCQYNNDSTKAVPYGKLYNWYAVTDARSLAPEGWHIPNAVELRNLMMHLGGDTIAGGRMKMPGTTAWLFPNEGAGNESGFSAVPGGYRFSDGSFHTLGSNGYWWTTTHSYEMFSWNPRLNDNFADIGRDEGFKKFGFAVRCVKD